MPAPIQTAIGTSATTTVAATFGAAPTSGSLLVAGVMNTDNFATTPAGWTQDAQRGDFGGIQLYHKVSDGTETTLTVTLGGAGSGSALMMAEFAHDGTTAGLLDVSASAGSGTGNVTSQATGTTGTTTRADELAIGCVGWGGGANASTPTFANTWTNSFAQAGTPATRQACGVSLAWRDLVATGTQTTTESVSVTNKMQGIVATFKVNAPPTGQHAAPVADTTVGAWTTDGGGATNLFAALDEATASDTDFARSELTPSGSAARFKFGALTDPAVSTGHVLRYRVGKDLTGGNTMDLTIKLQQGPGPTYTDIATFARNGVDALTTYTETLTGTQADSISDYSELYLLITATAS